MQATRTLVSKMLLGIVVLTAIDHAFSQGTFIFSNTGGNGGARAPVYGPEPGDPYLQRWGNPSDASPPGTQTYAGPLLAGASCSVEAWYSLTPAADVFRLMPNADPAARSLTSFLTSGPAGYFAAGGVTILNAIYTPGSNSPYMVYLQVRAWDNAGGRLGSWDSAWNAALAGRGNAVGWSKVFAQPLETRLVPWPKMPSFESFNIAIVPEPSTALLMALGAAAWFCSLRRSRTGAGRVLPRCASTVILGVVILASVGSALGQGTFVFSNTGVNSGTLAPIYGPDPGDPQWRQWGNTPQGQPPGTQQYGGALLAGAAYSVEGWYSLASATDAFALQTTASAAPRSLFTFFTGTGAGFFAGGYVWVPETTYNPNQQPGSAYGVWLQVRAWDNAGGQLGTWDAAWNAALAGSGKAVGWSRVFWQAAVPINFWPGLVNFESFNIALVPEPSTALLMGLGAAAWCWSRCRSRTGVGVVLLCRSRPRSPPSQP